jgi:predicted nucleic acid-binding protein
VIIHIDASALVKRYVLEAGTSEVETLLATADLAGAALISRAEVSAAICKAACLACGKATCRQLKSETGKEDGE